jgi:hypothetical protein
MFDVLTPRFGGLFARHGRANRVLRSKVGGNDCAE